MPLDRCHSLLWKAFSYVQVHDKISALVNTYVEDIQLCLNTSNHILAEFGDWNPGWMHHLTAS